MKKIISFLTALAMIVSVLPKSGMIELNHVKALGDSEKVVDKFIENKNIWERMAFDTSSMSVSEVGFIDLDFDGTLELFVWHQEGSGRYSYYEFYKLNDEKIEKVNIDLCHGKNNGFQDSLAELYYDTSSGEMLYCGNDLERFGGNEYVYSYCSLSYNDNIVKEKRYYCNYVCGQYSNYYDLRSDSRIEISEEQYKILETSIKQNWIDLNLNTKLVDVRSLNSEDKIKEALLDSYNSFSYDTYQKDYAPNSVKQIPESASSFNGHSYFFYNESMSWTEAESYCEELGGHLVSISNSEEQSFITQMINDRDYNRNCYWIGLRSLNNAWNWIDKTNFYYTNWAANEPNNENDTESYTHIFGQVWSSGYGVKGIGQWNDVSNTGAAYAHDFYDLNNFGFICEWDDEIFNTYGNFKYYVNSNDEVVITKYIGNDENVVIPSEINGKKVTIISGVEGPAENEYHRIGAFENNISIKSVIIPDSITTIEENAFRNCNNLSEVEMSKNINIVGMYAFYNCNLNPQNSFSKNLS